MDLADYQRAFLAALYAGEADTAGFLTAGTAHRFAAYHMGLRARFEESLREAFPATERLVGHPVFHALSRRYLQDYPSRTWDLSRVGEHFPAFLGAIPEAQAHPYLADLARFEWLLHDLFFAADRGEQAAFPADEQSLSDWKPTFSSTLRVFRSAWPIATLHQLDAEPQAGFSVTPEQAAYLVFRDLQGTVRFLPLTPAQADLQEALLKGQSLGDAVERVPALEANDISALAATWTANGLLRAEF